MPIKPKKVLILGSSALKIGEAGEFDYSGSQAIKALKDEGIVTILVNPNIATIQTSKHLADQVYFLPVNASFVRDVIEKERPDGILLGFGGQTSLNCGLALDDDGTLSEFGVEVLGTSIQTIRETEDRSLFVEKLSEIDVCTPRSEAVTSVDDAIRVAQSLNYPVMLRIAYALGGLGSGICMSDDDLRERATKAFRHTNQVLIEESLAGWKEVEYEVVRDCHDNCVTVCNMENVDPMGIHTGESIVVAPSQTLSNRDYHWLRKISIQVIRHLGIIGECNIQFAFDPYSEAYRVIEVNARLSRSSALASKATGYPLAYVAAKLGLRYGLHELPNQMTGITQACFEPALDYIVVKMPRWDLKKFNLVSKKLGSGMKSVGEVMAIGRTFEEALQKAIRMLDIGMQGVIDKQKPPFSSNDIDQEISEPTPDRVFVLAEAMKNGMSVERIYQLSKVNRWFLYKILHIVKIAQSLAECQEGLDSTDHGLLMKAKRAGFSDLQIAGLLNTKTVPITATAVRDWRRGVGIVPYVKQIDTLAAEYPAKSNYLYLTYNAKSDDAEFSEKPAVVVLGSGAYRIGSSVEFDWCCVNTVRTLRDTSRRTIMINHNPETVSTDYNECDALYFEEISLETVLEIAQKENPIGVILSMGGQVPNNLAISLHSEGVPILGTPPASIDHAEDRHKFSRLLDELEIKQPAWRELVGLSEALSFAKTVGYPVLIRPSYVLSGAAMGVASNETELSRFVERAASGSSEFPVVISQFLENAKELEMDAVAKNGELVLYAISEHIENAGVHSGDSTLVFPAQRTYLETIRRIKRVSAKIAARLNITGPFNIQFIAKDNEIKVIECNVRASRSFPFISKISKVDFIDCATRVIMGDDVSSFDGAIREIDCVGVKAPQFSFTRLDGADPILGVEMASTGEVGCIGDDFEEAFLKAMLSVGYRFPVKTILLSTGPVESKAAFLDCAISLCAMNVSLYATKGTAEFLLSEGVSATRLYWPLEETQPNVMEYLSQGKIDLVINIPKNYQEQELTNDYLIRRKAVDMAVPLITNIQLARRWVEAISRKQRDDLRVKSWAEY